MHLPVDLFARLKDVAHRQAQGLGQHTNQIVKHWFFLLVFGAVAVILAAGYAVYRFSYWSNLEEYLVADTNLLEETDRAAMEKILKEFDERAAKTKEILGEPLPSQNNEGGGSGTPSGEASLESGS